MRSPRTSTADQNASDRKEQEDGKDTKPRDNEPGNQPEKEDDAHRQIVEFDTQSGESSVLVTADQLTPPDASQPLDVADYAWSEDQTKLLIFTDTVKVWRQNTKGDYWLLDLALGTLRKVGAGAARSTLMFAKLSPLADRVAYVRDNNIYVEQLSTGETIPLTRDGTDKIINGTFDWVYEEELDLRDGFRWSPDGKQIAYWQLDSSGIQDFFIINNTDSLYPRLLPLPYPKVGTTNSACRIGVVSADGGETTWIKIPGVPREHYLASLEWTTDSKDVLIEQLNRIQNRRTLWQANIVDGSVRSVFRDTDEAWVDLRQKFDWFKPSTHWLTLSEQDGWRHAYRVVLDSGESQLLTPGTYDVIDLVGMADSQDPDGGWLYFTASPTSAVHSFLYRVGLSGDRQPERLTPDDQPGTHTYNVSPNGEWAVHTYSKLDQPPLIDLIALPSHEVVRTLEPNTQVRDALADVERHAPEFFQVTIEDGDGQPVALDGWMIKPPAFDDAQQYPVLFYVYTEPWGQTARDAWGAERYLWHVMLSQMGYVVVTVDNRGTPAPRGRAWRKAIYQKIGILNVSDQAAAAAKILQWPFLDKQRVAMWGWSGGGSMTLNAMFQHPEIYHVGMSVAPVGDQRLYDTIYQERYMGLPADDNTGLVQGSPVTHAKNLRGKLLLVHGTGDDNVHYQNAEVVINELIKHNRPFDMMSYPNRSHAINEGENTRVHLFELLTRYLTTQLPAGPRPQPADEPPTAK